MLNWSSVKPKSSFDRRNLSTSTSEKHSNAKKVIPKKSVKCSKDVKYTSVGVISTQSKPQVVKPKKTTKSDDCFAKTTSSSTILDYCKKCGDVYDAHENNKGKKLKDSGDNGVVRSDSDKSIEQKKKDKLRRCKVVTEESEEIQKIREDSNHTKLSRDKTEKRTHKETEKPDRKTNVQLKSRQSIQQYYKNENFGRAAESSHEINIHKYLRKSSNLDTIKELPEVLPVEEYEEGFRDDSRMFTISGETSDEDVTVIDPEDYESLRKLREFREDNYFECHSVKARTRHKGSATSVADHKCVYRFYLNDRLFPEPLNTDHHKNIRCTECHLPLDLSNKDSSHNFKDINGTIQAKVKLGVGDEAQDMVLMLPVKEPLIIREKRKEKKQKQDKEVMYFGVIKLDSYGNSIFNQTLPSDSLALKYQKGYKEFNKAEEFVYKEREEADVIVI